MVRYLGQTYDGKKPFDESFSSKTLEARQVGVGGYIKGWDKGLVGVKAGSRVMLLVPPSEGYGKAGSGQEDPGRRHPGLRHRRPRRQLTDRPPTDDEQGER